MGLIHVTRSRSFANVLVHEVRSFSMADLFVFVTESRSEAMGKEEIWYFTDAVSAARTRVCFVEALSAAELRICFVEARSRAGWRKRHRLAGRL
jgi:hypothetical protein